VPAAGHPATQNTSTSVFAGDFVRGGAFADGAAGVETTAVGCAAASVVELGAGRFDPREASRLAGGVEIVELEPAEVS